MKLASYHMQEIGSVRLEEPTIAKRIARAKLKMKRRAKRAAMASYIGKGVWLPSAPSHRLNCVNVRIMLQTGEQFLFFEQEEEASDTLKKRAENAFLRFYKKRLGSKDFRMVQLSFTWRYRDGDWTIVHIRDKNGWLLQSECPVAG